MSDRKKINKHYKKLSEMRRYYSYRVTNPALTLRDGTRKNLRNYVKRVTGKSSFSKYMLQSFMFTMLSDLPTVWASVLRAKVYRRVLGSVGSSCFIEKNVRFYVPQKIFFGDRVFIGENNYFDANNLEGEIRLEDDVHIGRNSTICISGGEKKSTSDKIHIHKNTAINAYNFLCSCGGIKIGKYCMLGFDVAILGAHSNRSQIGRIEIGEDVWIGAHVIVLPGVTIGKGSVVGAGAVVINNIPSYSIAVGFPAKVIGKRK